LHFRSLQTLGAFASGWTPGSSAASFAGFVVLEGLLNGLDLVVLDAS
jgi:hypothetical protein